MAFLEPLLELLRPQQCYQSFHGFGSLHLLSQNENEDEPEDEHHDHDDDDDDDGDDGDGGGGGGGGDDPDADADAYFILSFLFEPDSVFLSKT